MGGDDGEVPALVRIADSMLAAGSVRAGAVSNYVADSAALSDPGHRRTWRAGLRRRADLPACASPPRGVGYTLAAIRAAW